MSTNIAFRTEMCKFLNCVVKYRQQIMVQPDWLQSRHVKTAVVSEMARFIALKRKKITPKTVKFPEGIDVKKTFFTFFYSGHVFLRF